VVQTGASGQATSRCETALVSAFALLGKRWNGVILGTLAHGPARFSSLSRAVEGISDSMLSSRLSELTEAGLVRRVVAEGPPVAVDYHLSVAGDALIPALREISTWANDHLVV
jgi:DNA-binding HxlR family transcriptional regulator